MHKPEDRANEAATGGTTRLEQALSAFLRWQGGDPPEPAEQFLERHRDLDEYLRPMIEDAESDARPPSDGDDVRRLGDYQIVREIGRGGMGVVFEAWQVSLGRRVALKVLPPHVTRHPTALARFRREAVTAAKLKHAAIVPVYGFGSDGDTHFIAMELLRGAPLDKVLKLLQREPLTTVTGRHVHQAVLACGHHDTETREPETKSSQLEHTWSRGYVETAVLLVAKIADGLAFAHEQGVIHRDVKPSNIIVGVDGSAVLTDFGLARERGLPSLTVSGDFAGTPYYVSPEQALAKKVTLDGRTDVFSLGATLYELLTPRRPFEGDSSNEVIAAVLGREPADPQSLNPALASDLAAIVLKALEKDPARRYQTATDFADDLRAFLEYRPVQARRPTTAVRIGRWLRREPMKAGLAGVIVLLLGLGVYVAATQTARAAGEDALRHRRVESLLQAGYVKSLLEGPLRARPILEEVLRLDPGNPYAIVAVTRGFTQDVAADALEFLDRHEVEGYGTRALLRVRAAALFDLGRADEARAIELGEPEDPVELFVAAVLKMPGPRRTSSPEDMADAVQLLERAIYRSRSANFLNYAQLAYAASRAGDNRRARECAEALMVLWPESDVAYLCAGVALTFTATKRAIHAFEHALRINPDLQLAYRNLALALSTAGRLDDAIQADRRAIALDATDPIARSILTMHLMRKGEFDEAVKAMRTAVELEPNNARHRNMLGAALERAGDLQGALAQIRKSVELDPVYPRAHRGVLGICRRLGDHAGMQAEHERWLGLHPNDPSAHNELAKFLLTRGDRQPARALVAARRAAELTHGKDPDILVTLARAQIASGDRKAAQATLQQARGIVPTDAALRKEIEKLTATASDR